MQQTRFSMNAFLLVAVIFSAISYFFTIFLTQMADRTPVNAYAQVEGTDLGVLYSNLKPSGLYEGGEQTGTCRVEGIFGYDWGSAAEGTSLYLNEYRTSDFGLLFCDVVRIDTETFAKEVVLEDTVLRGRCASGELVCIRGALMPADQPETDPLCTLYSSASPGLRSRGGEQVPEVCFLDPENMEVLYSAEDPDAFTDLFGERYLERTLQEIREDVG